MCYVVITARSLLWLLISLMAFMSVLSAVLTPKWLIGPERTKRAGNSTEKYIPTVGIYNRCTRIGHKNQCGPFSFDGFATDDEVYPAVWKAALFFLALGLSVLCLTLLFGISSWCFQSMFKKSIISLAGAVQAFAGFCFVCGLVLYPWGWGAPRVQRLCGPDSEPFYLSECTFGWPAYAALLGCVLTLISAATSSCADKASAPERVETYISEGKSLICIS